MIEGTGTYTRRYRYLLFIMPQQSADSSKITFFVFREGHMDHGEIGPIEIWGTRKGNHSGTKRQRRREGVIVEERSTRVVILSSLKINLLDHRDFHSPQKFCQKMNLCKRYFPSLATLVFIPKLSPSTFKWIPMWHGSNDHPAFSIFSTSKITIGGERVKAQAL